MTRAGARRFHRRLITPLLVLAVVTASWVVAIAPEPAGAVSASGLVTEYAVPTANSEPQGIALGPDGNLWFTEYTGNKIGKITPGGVITEYPLPTANSQPRAITAGPDGNLWFIEDAGRKVASISTTGAITEYSLPVATFDPRDITLGPDGNLWVAMGSQTNLARVTTSGVITSFEVATATSITAGPDDNLWLTNGSLNRIVVVSTDGATLAEYSLGSPGSSFPWGITSGPDGNLWFTRGQKVGRITTAGVVTEFGVPVPPLSGPLEIISGPDGNLWYARGARIGKVTPSGVVTEYLLPSGSAQGLAAGPDGDLWFTQSTQNRIGRLGLGTPSGVTGVFLDGEPSENITLGQQLTFTSVTAGGSSSAGVTLTVLVGSEPYRVQITPPVGQPLAEGAYEAVAKVATASAAGLNVSKLSGSSDPRSCTTVSGRFVVDEASYDGVGAVQTFAAHFEQHCNGADTALFGSVSFDSVTGYQAHSLSPGSLSFGSVHKGQQSAPQLVTVTNSGPSALEVFSNSITGSDAADFSISSSTCVGVILAPATACQIGVRFAPLDGAGAKNAKLSIFDSVAPSGGSGRDVPLSGIGTTTATSFVVWTDPLGAVSAFDPLTVFVEAVDENGDLDSDYAGTVRLTSTDPGRAGFSTQTTFTNGGAVVNFGHLVTPGLQTITAFEIANPSLRGSVNVAVAPFNSPWYGLGGFITPDTSAVSDEFGGVYLFGRGGNGAVWYQYFDGFEWSGWTSLGGYTTSTPSAVTDGTNVYVFARGGDGGVWYRRLDGITDQWSTWRGLGGFTTTQPSAVMSGSDVYVFVRGGDGALYYQRITQPFTPSGWKGLGGFITFQPSAVSDGTNVHVFVRGSNGALWYQRVTPALTSSGWKGLGGVITSAPSAVFDGTNAYAFARGGNGALWYQRVTPASTALGWQGLGGLLAGTPSAIVDGPNIEVFVRGAGGGVWQRELIGGVAQPGWSGLGGGAVFNPTAVSSGFGIEVFVLGTGSPMVWWQPLVGVNSSEVQAESGSREPSAAMSERDSRLDRADGLAGTVVRRVTVRR